MRRAVGQQLHLRHQPADMGSLIFRSGAPECRAKRHDVGGNQGHEEGARRKQPAMKAFKQISDRQGGDTSQKARSGAEQHRRKQCNECEYHIKFAGEGRIFIGLKSGERDRDHGQPDQIATDPAPRDVAPEATQSDQRKAGADLARLGDRHDVKSSDGCEHNSNPALNAQNYFICCDRHPERDGRNRLTSSIGRLPHAYP
ncbi:hypothetical protein [Sphingobium yanoikuyae]|uniref:hypothetical protein n=1 Tax=Sphingobium yanoikuyae TaxID=13690 RepID=UPI0022DD8022|nr:hypothetical protein [Sphingobium yanoikuyae]WBQ18911.1 hypothetical protein PAE53_08820 [Sphingobium yanoikuyae]